MIHQSSGSRACLNVVSVGTVDARVAPLAGRDESLIFVELGRSDLDIVAMYNMTINCGGLLRVWVGPRPPPATQPLFTMPAVRPASIGPPALPRSFNSHLTNCYFTHSICSLRSTRARRYANIHRITG
jgi:hypothetical protein